MLGGTIGPSVPDVAISPIAKYLLYPAAIMAGYMMVPMAINLALAAGGNPAFATASGLNVDKKRVIGTTLSTVIAAVGIIIYSQSFGFMQLYTGPQQMGFIAASAILIGGATVSKAKVYHVILGTFLFQGVLAMGIQVANAMLAVGGLSEVMRILISKRIILDALPQAGGKGRK